MSERAPEAIAQAFEQACLAELDALKPGNVHRHAGGHKLDIAQFEASAAAAAPQIADPSLSVGLRIRHAAEATAKAAGTNTNLGIILLCAPLAAAAQQAIEGDLQQRLASVLGRLDIQDARDAYEGIRTAEPGGLGEVAEHDIAGEPRISLLATMAEAERRDRIAWNYSHDFADVFERGLRWRDRAAARGLPQDWQVSTVYMGFLGSTEDSLLQRKYGEAVARDVREQAQPLAAALLEAEDPAYLRDDLLRLDRRLKARGLNPGTSADLTVATVFAASLRGLQSPEK